MSLFVVERTFDPPIDPSTVASPAGAPPGPAMPGAHVLGGFIGRDGAIGFYTYESPDAATVRAGLHTTHTPFTALWPALASSPPAAPEQGDLFVVEERFEPPQPAERAARNDQLSRCLQAEGVGWVTSFLAADGSQRRCVYRTPDADAIRRAYLAAGTPFTRMWRAAAASQ